LLRAKAHRRSLHFAAPDFLLRVVVAKFMRLSLTESRTRGHVQRGVYVTIADTEIEGNVSSVSRLAQVSMKDNCTNTKKTGSQKHLGLRY
jgi:hypothetical protein